MIKSNNNVQQHPASQYYIVIVVRHSSDYAFAGMAKHIISGAVCSCFPGGVGSVFELFKTTLAYNNI